METQKPESKTDSEAGGRKQAIAGIALAAVVGLALVLVLVLSGEDSSPSSPNGAEVLSAEDLREAVSGSATPVYWAGEQEGAELELTQPDSAHAYVRYLTGDAEAGDSRPDFLTVATYARPNAAKELRQEGKQPGAVLGEAPGGAVVYYDRSRPQSVYLAYPGVDVQIEVYDPNVRRALRLVNSGQIVALG
jgi:hypothetical protein